MEDREDQENRTELISRLFALLTAKLEDAATIAAECQAPRQSQQLLEGAGNVEDLSSEAMIIAAAVSAILCNEEPSTYRRRRSGTNQDL